MSSELTDSDLAAIAARNEERERLRNAATPGPWIEDGCGVWGYCPLLHNPQTHTELILDADDSHPYDREFLVHARNDDASADVRTLLAEVTRLRAELAAVKSDNQ